jgi:hypothetical protein
MSYVFQDPVQYTRFQHYKETTTPQLATMTISTRNFKIQILACVGEKAAGQEERK